MINFNEDDVVEICTNCKGGKPCWCDLKEEQKVYIRMDRWVYDALTSLNPA